MFENLSKGLLEKAQKATTKEEALAILREGGFELTDDDLKNISGGEDADGICWTHEVPCSFLCPTHSEKCVSHCLVHCSDDHCGCVRFKWTMD